MIGSQQKATKQKNYEVIMCWFVYKIDKYV
jgi:hypothetical protein